MGKFVNKQYLKRPNCFKCCQKRLCKFVDIDNFVNRTTLNFSAEEVTMQ